VPEEPPQPADAETTQRGTLREPDVQPDDRALALFVHLSVLLHILLPVIALAAPLIVWYQKRDESPFIEDHARDAFNFQVSLILYNLGFWVLGFVTCGVGWALNGLVSILGLIGMILASIAANRGEYFRYPMTLRWLGPYDPPEDEPETNPGS
jgi:uncharacterized Tic20 family protein